MRLAGSYSSILSKRSRSRRCSVPSDNRNFCTDHRAREGSNRAFPRALAPALTFRSLGSPGAACTWLSRGVQPWSSGSSPDVPGGSTSALWEERSRSLRRSQSLGCSGWGGVGLPAALDHPARDGPLDSLHHGQVLPVVVGLQEKPGENPEGGGGHHQLPAWRRRTW